MTKEIIPTNGIDWLAEVENLSALSPQVALNVPLGDLVIDVLNASASDSPKTARAYKTGIGCFLQWLGGNLGDKLPEDWRPLAIPTQKGRKTVWEFRGTSAVLRTVTAATLDGYSALLKAEGKAQATVAQRMGAVNTLLNVAFRDGILTSKQAENMRLKSYKKRQRRNEQPVGKRLTPDQVKALRASIDLRGRREIKVARDKAIFDLMLYAGLRCDEVASMRLENIKQDGGCCWLVFSGKGGKTRRVKIHMVLYKSLEAWIGYTGATMANGSTGAIFCNLRKNGEPTGNDLSGSVISRLVAEYGAAAGLYRP